MSEKFPGQNPERNQFDEKEYYDLLYRARQGMDTLSPQDRERLTKFGYHYLEVGKNKYEAMRTFEALQDFEGLRKTADQYLRERSDEYDLLHVLTLLEDHEGIRNLLNGGVKTISVECGDAFTTLEQPLHDYVQRFLNENGTPIATGGINKGVDLIAIRNLSHNYDVAVPIARGGLNQGAIANLWDMPTRIVDIAAHNRKVPKGKWVNPVATEDFNGKRVLLFDKDAVSGSSIRQAVKMLSRFKTASIGVYFTHRVVHPVSIGIGTRTSGLPEGLEIFSPSNAPLEKAGDVYIEAHEKLGTLYGRRLQIGNLFTEEAQKLQEQFPELAEFFRTFVSEQFRVFDSLNPNLPGILEIREQILLNMNNLYRDHLGFVKDNMYSLPGVAEKFKKILTTTKPMPLGFESELIRARFRKQGEEAAKRRNVENPHYPSNPLAAFNAAQQAVKEGFDMALIVGPEGFAYEPYFHDLGVKTIAVNIPESGEDEPRTIKIFDDLSVLQGKKVLVVEDDIRTGATLQKLLEHLEPHNPGRLGLYLGQPERFQRVTNIPPEFENTYLAEDSKTVGKEFGEYLESKGLKIFKTTKTSK